MNKIMEELSKLGGVVLRRNVGMFRSFTNPRQVIRCGMPGEPDLEYIHTNGKVYFFEVKTATGRASAEQINFLERLRKLHTTALIVRSPDEAVKAVIG